MLIVDQERMLELGVERQQVLMGIELDIPHLHIALQHHIHLHLHQHLHHIADIHHIAAVVGNIVVDRTWHRGRRVVDHLEPDHWVEVEVALEEQRVRSDRVGIRMRLG
jgi:23S rRNA G2445 N2-methylase RlmL